MTDKERKQARDANIDLLCESKGEIPQEWEYEDGVLIRLKGIRVLCRRYAQRFGTSGGAPPLRPLSWNELDYLMNTLRTKEHFLLPLVTFIRDSENVQIARHTACKTFLGSLASETVAIPGLVAPRCTPDDSAQVHVLSPLLRTICETLDSGEEYTLSITEGMVVQASFPCLYAVLKPFSLRCPLFLLGVLLRVVDRLDEFDVFVTLCRPLTTKQSVPLDPESVLHQGIILSDTAVTKRGPFGRPTRHDSRCRKRQTAPTSSVRVGVSAGIFCLSCPHGYLIRTQIMGEHESPETLFTLVSGFQERAPRILVYDASCHASTYSNGRDPDYWRDTVFMSDRFHYNNHVTCGYRFNPHKYEGKQMRHR